VLSEDRESLLATLGDEGGVKDLPDLLALPNPWP